MQQWIHQWGRFLLFVAGFYWIPVRGWANMRAAEAERCAEGWSFGQPKACRAGYSCVEPGSWGMRCTAAASATLSSRCICALRPAGPWLLQGGAGVQPPLLRGCGRQVFLPLRCIAVAVGLDNCRCLQRHCCGTKIQTRRVKRTQSPVGAHSGLHFLPSCSHGHLFHSLRCLKSGSGLHPFHWPLRRSSTGVWVQELGGSRHSPWSVCRLLLSSSACRLHPAPSLARCTCSPSILPRHACETLPPTSPQLFFVERRGSSDRSNKHVLHGDAVEAIAERAVDRRCA